MHRLAVSFSTFAFLIGLALPPWAGGQASPPPPPPVGIGPTPGSVQSFPKDLLLVWAFRLRGFEIPKSLEQTAQRPEALKSILIEELRREYRKHLTDDRFQVGWNGISPGVSKRKEIVALMGLPDYSETRDLTTRWLYRNKRGAKTIVFEYAFNDSGQFQTLTGQEDTYRQGDQTQAASDPQIVLSIRIIPDKTTLAAEIRQRHGPPDSIEYSDDAVLQWVYLRGILVEFLKDQTTVSRIIFRVNDILRLG